MTDRPILFNGAMVRAILAGKKTQTRRALRDQAPVDLGASMHGAHLRRQPMFDKVANRVVGTSLVDVRCPFGRPGDRLWVRETWGVGSRPDPFGGYDGIEYRADEELLALGDDLPCHKVDTPDGVDLCDYRSGWKPSIHMPRWASRLMLEVTDVRVERLQAITTADAEAEGAIAWTKECPSRVGAGPLIAFRTLWDSTGGDWAANPWVWVVGFRIAEGQANG